MAYSNVGIANLGLGQLGVSRISSFTEGSTASIAITDVWDYVRDEVLSERDWVFAVKRVALAKSTLEPVYNYSYAYGIPADFLRLAKQKTDDPSVYYAGSTSEISTLLAEVYQVEWAYTFETLTDDDLYLLTNYDNTDYDLYIRYIAKITDPAKYSPLFIKAFAARLAAEVAVRLTESTKKRDAALQQYEGYLKKADGFNQSFNYVQGELGNTDWDKAGR